MNPMREPETTEHASSAAAHGARGERRGDHGGDHSGDHGGDHRGDHGGVPGGAGGPDHPGAARDARAVRRPARVLVVEDEESLAQVLVDNLLAEGHDVRVARDGEAAMAAWRGTAPGGAPHSGLAPGGAAKADAALGVAPPDLVVLDVMLPRIDGYELCRRMRAEGFDTAVLYLSARGEPEDRVRGLRAGGDDYLPKPFHLPEFLLRVQALLRRRGWGQEAAPEEFAFSFAGHRVDYRAWTAELADGRREPLGERELGIFRALAERAGEVVSRDEILDRVWGNDAFPSSRTVDNFVVRLRRLFEPDPSAPIYFHTVWGVGYRFTPEGTGAGRPAETTGSEERP